jgi:hypothetical protein
VIPARVKVRLLCDRCRKALDLCVPVERHVPAPLACVPGGPVQGGGESGGPGMSCAVCGVPWNATVSDIERLVNDATRRGWGEHIRNGAVLIHCPVS